MEDGCAYSVVSHARFVVSEPLDVKQPAIQSMVPDLLCLVSSATSDLGKVVRVGNGANRSYRPCTLQVV